MKYNQKTKEQLINGSAGLHQRIENLEARKTKHNRSELDSDVYFVDHNRNLILFDNNK